MNEEEVWKDIPYYEGLYEASNMGRVRSVDREVRHPRGGVHVIKGKVLKSGVAGGGYLQVVLYKDGNSRAFKVHRLVYAAFCGEIPNGYDVNHIDECKTNNRLDNLNLMTRKENNNWGTHNQRVAKANTNNPLRCRPVVALNEDGEVISEFSPTREAGRNGFNQGDLVSCCRGRYKTHRGYRWKFKEDIEKT